MEKLTAGKTINSTRELAVLGSGQLYFERVAGYRQRGAATRTFGAVLHEIHPLALLLVIRSLTQRILTGSVRLEINRLI